MKTVALRILPRDERLIRKALGRTKYRSFSSFVRDAAYQKAYDLLNGTAPTHAISEAEK